MESQGSAADADSTQGSLSLSSPEDTASAVESETGTKPSGRRKRKEKKFKLKRSLNAVQVDQIARMFGFTIEDFEEVKEKKKRDPDQPRENAMSAFFVWWGLYPKKDIQGAAMKAWKELQPDSDTVQAMIRDVQKRVKSFDWTKDGGKWIPYAHSYIRGKRWLDQGIDQSLIQRRTVL